MTPMNPMLSIFLRLTAVVTLGLVLLFVTAFLLKIVVIAAVIAGLIIAGFFVYTLFRRRQNLPVIR